MPFPASHPALERALAAQGYAEPTPVQAAVLPIADRHNAYADEVAARLFVETLQRLEPELLLYCMPGSATWRIGRELGQPLVREFYADRDYDRSGSIVFTRRVAALDPQQVADKVLRACREGKVRTVEGHARRNEQGEVVALSPIQQKFLEHFSFQCGQAM